MLIWMPFTDLETQASIASRLAASLLGVSALTIALAIGYGQTAYAQTCEDIATGGDITRSVVVTAQDGVFDNADFSLQRTLGQIIETADAVNTPAERIAMVQSIVRSFNRPEFENPTSGLTVPVHVRPEANLDPIKLLDSADLEEGMHPVGLFNRFDLADAPFETCGEHRIVYMLGDGQPFDHRMTLIFEAAVPNPAPQLDEGEGCLPIVRFWKELEGVSDPAEMGSRFEAFYYTGLDLDEDGTPDLAPVVHADHFGLKGGQVRGNMFVVDGTAAQNQWQLREWLVGRNTDTSPTFTVETVKDNPQEEFYTDIGDPLTDFADLQRRFQQEFVSLNLVNLMRPEINAEINNTPLTTATEVIASIAAGFANQYHDFQSIAGDPGGDSPDEPRTHLEAAGKDFLMDIENQLGIFDLAGLPTASQIANRAGAMTCGGCHQFSSGEPIAPPLPGETAEVVWPASLTFVHIDEQGDLSPALKERFLIARCNRIEGFLAEHEQPEMAAEAFVAEVKGVVPQALQVQTVRDVEQAQRNFMAAQTQEQRSIALGNLEAAVEIDRSRREQTPGAFYAVRRTH
jgi:hypothetical protein